MTLKRSELTGGLLVVAMIALSAWALTQVGGHRPVPIHWDLAGNPNGYASPVLAFAITPALALLVLGFLAVIPRIEPRREHLQQSEPAYAVLLLSLLVFVAVVHVLVIVAAVTGRFESRVLAVGLGLLIAVIGNNLGKVQSNFFVGVRTPWTLSSELSWDRTHRLAGRILVAAGLLCLVLALWSSALALAAITGLIAASIPVLVTYSYVVWRVDPARDRHARPMQRRRFAFALIIVLVFGLAAVAGLVAVSLRATENPLVGAARTQVLAYSEPQTDNLMTAYVAGDYPAAIRDFDPAMRQGLTKKVFDEARSSTTNAHGRYLGRQVTRVFDRNAIVTVVYAVQFTHQDAVMTVSFTESEPHQIAGWWFR